MATLHAAEEALGTEKDVSGKLKLYEELGDAAIAANCFERAIDYYRKMLACAEEIKSDRIGAALLSLAQTLKDVKRYNEAIDFARRELELCTDPREICRSALFLADLLIDIEAIDEQVEEAYELAMNNAKACNDVSLEASVLKERLNYSNNSGKVEEIAMLGERLNALKNLADVADSGDESEENNIGADICLEDLSDVENELRAKENVRMNRKRARKKSVAVKRNEKGETQLHVACISGNVEAVEKLLVAGHSTQVRDHFGWTPLHEAANHGHIEVAKLLLQHGADVNDPGSLMCQGVTPLHDAASCGNTSMMQLLIEHGANVELKANEGDTVLDCLEQWRDRVDYLSPEDRADYDSMHGKLSAIIPASARKNSKRPSKSRSSKNDGDEKPDAVEKISAGEDYKRTIASLKRRSNPIGALVATKRAVKPLLNSEDVLSDDWLEDDIKESVEKRHSDDLFSKTKRRSSNGDVDNEKSSKRQKKSEQNPTMRDAEPDLIDGSSNESCDTEVTRSLSERKFGRGKRQASLLAIGFSKNSVSRTPSPMNPSPIEFEARDSGTVTKSVILNVSVEDKVFKTQVELSSATKPSVQDILTDIEKKFFDDCGCKAKFDLKTMDGIVLNSNNVFTILNEGDIVKKLKCEINELEIPSIVERYGTICKSHKIGKYAFLLSNF